MLLLIPDIVNEPRELVKDIVDLVAVGLLPFLLWVYNKLDKLEKKQIDHQHILKGVDGTNGINGKVKSIDSKIAIIERNQRDTNRRMTMVSEQYPINYTPEDLEEK